MHAQPSLEKGGVLDLPPPELHSHLCSGSIDVNPGATALRFMTVAIAKSTSRQIQPRIYVGFQVSEALVGRLRDVLRDVLQPREAPSKVFTANRNLLPTRIRLNCRKGDLHITSSNLHKSIQKSITSLFTFS